MERTTLMHRIWKFVDWLRRVLKKWIWALGFLPQLLDYVSTYIPADYVPSFISDLLEVGGNWQLTGILVAIGLLISAFLVQLEVETKLADYEHQEPKYALDIEVSSKICRGGQVHIDCKFIMNSLNPWPGTLAEVGIEDRQNQLKGLGEWKLTGKPVGLPRQIRQPEHDFDITIHAEIIGSIDVMQRSRWESVTIPLFLLLEYYTQPNGLVRKSLPLSISVDLGQQFDSIAESQSRTG
jgi:hypothetical protein